MFFSSYRFLPIAFCLLTLSLSGHSKATEILPYPDLFTAILNIEKLGPEYVYRLATLMQRDCEALRGRVPQLCRVEEAVSEFNERTEWLNSQAYSDVTQIGSGLIELRAHWNELDLRSVAWSFSLGLPNESEAEILATRKVMGWLHLRDSLSEELEIVDQEFARRPQVPGYTVREIQIPLAKAWLSSAFVFKKVLSFARQMRCEGKKGCRQMQDALMTMVYSKLSRYENRIKDIAEALATDSIYYSVDHGERLRALELDAEISRSGYQIFASNSQLSEAKVVQKIIDRALTGGAFLEDQLVSLFLGLQIRDMERELESRPKILPQSISRFALAMPGFARLDCLIEEEISKAVRKFETEFSFNQRDIREQSYEYPTVDLNSSRCSSL